MGKVGFIDDGIGYGVEDEEDGGGEESENEDRDMNEQQQMMGTSGDGLETGSILERVKGFNQFLEKVEKLILEASLRS